MSLTQKLKTRRVAGMIQEWFRVGDKTYVHSRPDPNSFYLPKPDNTLRELRNPVDILIAELVYGALYCH